MKWLKWALGESALRTAGMVVQKVIGATAAGFPLVLFSTFVMSIVQVATACHTLSRKHIGFFPSKRSLLFGSLFFGVGAFVNTTLAFSAYTHGASMAIYTVLTLLAIVPGAMIDRIFFKEPITIRIWIGILLALFAGWLLMGTPTLDGLSTVPVWMILGIVNALGLAVNQGLSRSTKDINPWHKNFWGGCTTLVCAFMAALFYAQALLDTNASQLWHTTIWSIILGGIVIGMWSFDAIAYRDGAPIAGKQVVVHGAFLTGAVCAGYLFFGDTITPTQLIGMLMYLCAFSIMHREVWSTLRYYSKRVRATS